MPLGKLTPTIEHHKVLAKAQELRNAMADCNLSDKAISLIALRVNTGASVAQLARGLGIDRSAAHVMLSRPQAQHLIADLAKALMGDAAIMGAHTMMRLMQGEDASLAYRAATDMMERAGLGLSQRTQPDGATKTVFAFAFGAPQAVEHQPHSVAPAPAAQGWDPTTEGQSAEGALKIGHSRSGEATSRLILEQPEGMGPERSEGLKPTRPARSRTVKRS